MKVVMIGSGWLTSQLAVRLQADGHQVWLTSRSAEKSFEISKNYGSFVLDLAKKTELTAELNAVFQHAVVICAVPASRTDGVGYYNALANLAALMLQSGVLACIHCSTTGIYQGLAGEVDEQSQLQLSDPRVSLLAQAELVLADAVPCCTLRLAGLIGPGRHPARFLSGKASSGAEVAVNMVHNDDIADAVSAILRQQLWPELYNLSCPEFCAKGQFYQRACELAALPLPLFDGEVKQGENRRVSSKKSQAIPGFSYRFYSALDALPFCS
jgi:nucleoside-diphosphate-sugar epimerase